MKSLTIRLPDDLMDWLDYQAGINYRSMNKHVELLLEAARALPLRDATCQTGSTALCSNGKHNFIKPQPDGSEFCNCGMYVFGEVVGR